MGVAAIRPFEFHEGQMKSQMLAAKAFACGCSLGGVILLLAVDFAAGADIDRVALERAITKYSTCQAGCAGDLAKQLAGAAPNAVLTVLGQMKAADKTPKSLAILTAWVTFKSLYDAGAKIVDDNAACYQSCDKLNAEITALGQSGALGPMLKGNEVDPAILNNTKVFDAYMKFVKPIPLPAEERSTEWGKYISSLS
jgi:hypothetical protein